MINRIFVIMMLVLGTKSMQAQMAKPGLAKHLLGLCEAITTPGIAKQKIFDAFSFANAVQKKEVDYPEALKGFQLDTIYTLESRKPGTPIRIAHSRTLIVYRKNERRYYELSFVLGNTYTLNKAGKVQYEQTNDPLNLSYPELNELFGKPVSAFGSIPQPKDTKHYNYLYTNPKTKLQVMLSLISYNDPGSDYNTLYKITVANKELTR